MNSRGFIQLSWIYLKSKNLGQDLVLRTFRTPSHPVVRPGMSPLSCVKTLFEAVKLSPGRGNYDNVLTKQSKGKVKSKSKTAETAVLTVMWDLNCEKLDRTVIRPTLLLLLLLLQTGELINIVWLLVLVRVWLRFSDMSRLVSLFLYFFIYPERKFLQIALRFIHKVAVFLLWRFFFIRTCFMTRPRQLYIVYNKEQAAWCGFKT